MAKRNCPKNQNAVMEDRRFHRQPSPFRRTRDCFRTNYKTFNRGPGYRPCGRNFGKNFGGHCCINKGKNAGFFSRNDSFTDEQKYRGREGRGAFDKNGSSGRSGCSSSKNGCIEGGGGCCGGGGRGFGSSRGFRNGWGVGCGGGRGVGGGGFGGYGNGCDEDDGVCCRSGGGCCGGSRGFRYGCGGSGVSCYGGRAGNGREGGFKKDCGGKNGWVVGGGNGCRSSDKKSRMGFDKSGNNGCKMCWDKDSSTDDRRACVMGCGSKNCGKNDGRSGGRGDESGGGWGKNGDSSGGRSSESSTVCAENSGKSGFSIGGRSKGSGSCARGAKSGPKRCKGFCRSCKKNFCKDSSGDEPLECDQNKKNKLVLRGIPVLKCNKDGFLEVSRSENMSNDPTMLVLLRYNPESIQKHQKDSDPLLFHEMVQKMYNRNHGLNNPQYSQKCEGMLLDMLCNGQTKNFAITNKEKAQKKKTFRASRTTGTHKYLKGKSENNRNEVDSDGDTDENEDQRMACEKNETKYEDVMTNVCQVSDVRKTKDEQNFWLHDPIKDFLKNHDKREEERRQRDIKRERKKKIKDVMKQCSTNKKAMKQKGLFGKAFKKFTKIFV